MIVLFLSLFCYALLCAHSSFAIILQRKRKLVALLLLSYRTYYKCSVSLSHGAEGWSAVCDCGISCFNPKSNTLPLSYCATQTLATFA